MKKIFLFVILLSIYSFAQENRTVRQNDMRDTLNANSRGFLLEADSTQFRTFSNLKYLENADSTSQRTFSDLKYISKASLVVGEDSIHYGADSIVVSHGVGSTPTFVVIQLISDGFGFQTWVSGTNSLTFYVRRSDTGLKTINDSIKFKWMAYK